MKVGIIGAGKVGATLASALGAAGHEVTVGVRDRFDRDIPHARTVTIADAVDGAEAVILALPGGAVDGFLEEHGPALEGTVAIDAANSIGGDSPVHHAASFALHAPGALMVRAFNSLGWENFADPTFGDERTDLYWCGSPGRATEVAERLIADVGLRPMRLGGPEAVDVVDGVLRLWFSLVREHGGRRQIGFKTLGV